MLASPSSSRRLTSCWLLSTSSHSGVWEPTASWAVVVDRRMVIACWWWMVETPPVPACRAPHQSQRSHQTAAAPNSCNTRNQNQFCQLCRRLYMEHCHVSCGDIFGHFHSFNETNLQIFGRNPSVPGVHKPANNSQLLDVMGTSFTDGVETQAQCHNMVPKV